MDIVFVKGITAEAVIGVYEWEKHVSQKLTIDVEIGTDFSAAAVSDNLRDAVDYQAVAERVVDICAQSKCLLLEKLITEIADSLWQQFDLQWLRVTLDKGGVVRSAKSVGLIVERGSRN